MTPEKLEELEQRAGEAVDLWYDKVPADWQDKENATIAAYAVAAHPYAILSLLAEIRHLRMALSFAGETLDEINTLADPARWKIHSPE